MAHEWTELYPPSGYPEDKDWSALGCSSDGSVMLAGVYGRRLYLSTDRGDTWTEVQPAGDVDKNWMCCACDSDGSVLLAGVYYGRLYLSTDGGANWTEVQPAGDADKTWACCACDSDGSVLIAGVDGGRLYLSTNGGSSWVEKQPAGAVDKSWRCCTSDSDGSVLLVGASGGRLYLSINTGSSWSEKQPAGAVDKSWRTCVADSDGSVLVAGVYNGRLYLSTNTGTNWSEVQPGGNVNKAWYSSACSADGSVLLVAAYGNRLYLSTNTGTDWSEVRPAGNIDRNWRCCASDSDGSVLLAGAYDQRLYLGLTGCPVLSLVNPASDGAAVPSLTPRFTFGTANEDSAPVHVVLQVSTTPTFGSYDINSDSTSDYTNWQQAVSPFETWTTMPSGGATAGNRIRYPVTSSLRYDVYFARAQLKDGTHKSGVYRFTFTIVAESDEPLVVVIGGTTYQVGACSIAEETGGEAGAIGLEIPLSAYLAHPVAKGASVAISSGLAGGRTWNATVETRKFSGSVVQIHCLQDDAYLSRRVVTGDLSSADLGANLKALVNTYGSPLTAFNVDVTTDVYGALAGGYKYLREHFGDVLKQLPAYLYWVDETGDVHLIDQDDLPDPVYVLFEEDPSG